MPTPPPTRARAARSDAARSTTARARRDRSHLTAPGAAASVPSDRSWPYMVRGRVLHAMLNCPGCGWPIRFRSVTAHQRRCPNPTCRETMHIGLVVRMAAVRGGPGDRPLDTLMAPAPGEPHVTLRDMLDPEPDPLAGARDGSVDPMPPVPVDVAWRPGSALNVLVTAPAATPPPDRAVDSKTDARVAALEPRSDAFVAEG